ncbi:hypothetical protein Patl1_24358 [Pistacia atlantica]|uniref:Uncharacterized protein n=1 Tax=Pistacia atlantica TaxID=434234 RepID=A0ACC0ZVW4_9ROSI|nr:hypothetical protein Patl1_24358 [Pistacia atlantica]
MKPYLVRFLSIFFLVYPLCQPSNCQQSYQENRQLNCQQDSSDITEGYLCYGSAGPQILCQSYVTFRSRPPYDSPISITSLLGSEPSTVALVNNISSSDKIPSETIVIVPISCSCSNGIYQHNTSYKILISGETYFSVANNTYQGLSTCQALADQNNNDDGKNSAGFKFDGSTEMCLSKCRPDSNRYTFEVNENSILESNMLSLNGNIYPFTSLLVPLKTENCSTNPAKFFCSCANCSLTDGSTENHIVKPGGRRFPVKLVIIFSQFTEKSDVDSFGVVLVELLTGKTPLSYARAEEKNLVTCFISLAKENQLLEILDTRVAKEAREEDIQSIAELVMRCLRLNGKKRPTMKEVATELEGLIRSRSCLETYREPHQVRDEMLYVETSEETGQGSTEEGLEFSVQMESNSF